MTASRNDPAREARLKAALKANIARRKSQARARAGAAAAEPQEAGPENARQSGESTGRAAPSSERDTG